MRVVAAEVWKVAPPIDGQRRRGLGAAALGMLTKPKDQGFKSLLNMIAIEGQDIREHARLKSATIARSILPASKGGGRMLNESDVGQAARRDQHQDRPRLPQRRRLAQAGRPDDQAGHQGLHDRRPLRHRLAPASTRRS